MSAERSAFLDAYLRRRASEARPVKDAPSQPNSVHVHVTESEANAPLRYLVLRLIEGARVELDFECLEPNPEKRPRQVVLSVPALEQVLNGAILVCDLADGRLDLVPEQESLVILFDPGLPQPEQRYRVWLSELAVGWNMLDSLINRLP